MSTARLAGKVALITGAASGIGAAHAQLFARHGAKILLCDIQESLAHSVKQSILDSGGVAEFCRLNIADNENWEHAVTTAQNRFGTLTTLVNAAGVASRAGIEGETREGWDKVIAINQTGTWLGMKSALPALVVAGNSAIVNIASMLAIVSAPGAIAYQASKAAILQMTKSVALEFATRGVRANTVCPGVIKTPMTEGGPDIVRDYHMQSTPIKRLGHAEEVAYCSLFLCSDEASYVTGADLVVDGGTSVSLPPFPTFSAS